MFQEIIKNRTDIAEIRFKSRGEWPAWAITKYIEDTCLIHMKMSIIQKICELSLKGASDWRFSAVVESAALFPTISFSDEDYRDKTIRANKWKDSESFWRIINGKKRPIVLFELDNGEKIPLNDYGYNEAIRITNLSVSSPFKGVLTGLVGPLLDAYQVTMEEERRSIEHLNKQIGQTARNLENIIRTTQLLENSNLSSGLRTYAQNSINALIQKQQELNRKLGIETEGKNIKI